MHDLKIIRQNPDDFKINMLKRGIEAHILDALLALDIEKRDADTGLQNQQGRKNKIAKLIGEAKRKGQDTSPLVQEGLDISEKIKALQEKATLFTEKLEYLVLKLPNIAHPHAPIGDSEADNVIPTVGIPNRPVWMKPHWEFTSNLGLDTEAGVRLSGSRYTVLYNGMARLERALGQWMLNQQIENGYQEVAVPHIVNRDILVGTGQLPKFENDLFKVGDEQYLIPTAEVPLTNLVRNQVLEEKQLPLRLTALTPCYRAEAGSAGRDTRGYIRQHQFYKVEMVSLVTPEMADDEHERMTRCAETILEKLCLPYRRIELCTADMGFSAQRTFDLEVWMPGQNAWREISSCSTCGDFQTRRMGTRLKGRKDLPVSLNGSGLAVGRTLVAILENYQQQDGSVDIPEPLWPYMAGRKLEVMKPI